MKTLRYSLMTLIFSVFVVNLFAQGNITIQGGGAVTVNGNTFIIPCPPTTPTAGTQVPSQTQIIWNWNPVLGATGYKWNLTDDYNSAIDMGTTTSKTETGLLCGTSYNSWVWAYNNCGKSLQSPLTATTSFCGQPCPGLPFFTDVRDGKTYRTVLIGTQCWMAQNLNIGTIIDSVPNQTNNNILEKYCPQNQESNCDKYGGYYQWAESVQYLNGATNVSSWYPVPTGHVHGICPSGWHLPSDAEWSVLTTFLGSETTAGGKMKESGTINWISPNTDATNISGFTGLPTGQRGYGDGQFGLVGMTTYMWSSSENSANTSWVRGLKWDEGKVSNIYARKHYGFPVRCLKD